jgi:hypothetical protein
LPCRMQSFLTWFDIFIIGGGQLFLLHVSTLEDELSGFSLCITLRIDIVRVIHKTHCLLVVHVAATQVYVHYIGGVRDLAGLKTWKGTFVWRWTSCRRISMLLWGATTFSALMTAFLGPLEWCSLQQFPRSLYSSLLLHVWLQCSLCFDSDLVSSKLL